MSQAGIVSTTATPTVPTSFTTDVLGPAVPAANILQLLGDDTEVDNANGIRTSGATNVATIELTNRLQGTASVTGAVTGDIITFTLDAAAAKVYRFEFKVAGRDTGTDDGVGYTVDASAKCDGAGTATMIGAPFQDADEDASLVGATMDVVASGNTIILQATGIAVQTISYSAVGTYVVV
tara:strand:+ start:19566 stop:20105 length:540 start_codon:yes stop_codon:yes gene_type:complete